MSTTSEPGFECPECNARLYQSMRCPICGWSRKGKAVKDDNFPGSVKVLPAVYREPIAHAEYVEPTEAEHREIRINLGETLEKLAVSMTRPGRGILHERGQGTPAGEIVSRFANEAAREDEKMRQLEAFAKWQEKR